MSSSDAQSFVQALSTEPSVQKMVEEHGTIETARETGYSISDDELESAIKAHIETDLPDHEIDGKVDKRADSSSTCKSTSCGGKSCH